MAVKKEMETPIFELVKKKRTMPVVTFALFVGTKRHVPKLLTSFLILRHCVS